MPRMTLSIAAVALLAGATVPPAQAAVPAGTPAVSIVVGQSYLDVIAMLEEAGYSVIGMKSTLLGRLKIQAQNKEHLREVVVSRSTGEIKSDRITRVFAGEAGSTRQGAATPASGTASTGSGGGNSVSAGGVSASVGTSGVSASVGGVSASLGN